MLVNRVQVIFLVLFLFFLTAINHSVIAYAADKTNSVTGR